MAENRHTKQVPVSASELAQMGTCERLVWFEHNYGRRTTHRQQLAVHRGNAVHSSFYQDALRYEPHTKGIATDQKSWCWIASAAYGPTAPETQALRTFRDLVLSPCAAGRLFITAYYRTARPIATLVSRSRLARYTARALLRPFVILASRVARKHDA